MTSNHIAAYQGLIASLQGFSGTADLKGAAYDSAKTYASSVLVPLLQGAILLSEKIASSTVVNTSKETVKKSTVYKL